MRPPFHPTAARYLLGEFGRTLLLALGAFVGLYLCVDFFERFPAFLKHGASGGLIALYFLLKIPLIITQMMPAAVLAGILLGFGGLARRNELMAMRACGISMWQIGNPVIIATLLISVATLGWNEYVVPATSDRAHYVERVQIKGRDFKGHLGETEIWYHGRKSFTNIDRFDADRREMYGVKHYMFDDDFELERIVEADIAQWVDGGWTGTNTYQVVFTREQSLDLQPLGRWRLPIEERPEDLSSVHRDTDDLSFASLTRQIRDLGAMGIDTTRYQVELWLKTAIPFVSLIMALIAVPLSARHSRSSGVAASVGAAIIVGFAYWIVLGLAQSLGRSGVLPPPIAAWLANVLFGAVGAIFFLSSE